MPRLPARFTQADVARAIRAAKQAGAAEVELRPDGVIAVSISAKINAVSSDIPLDEEEPVEL